MIRRKNSLERMEKKVKKEIKKEEKKLKKEEKRAIKEAKKLKSKISSKNSKFTLKSKISFLLVFSLALASAIFLIYKNVLASVLSIFAVFAISFGWDFIKKKTQESTRVSKMEEVFPDFLQLVSSNLRAGMTIDRALILSAREEFAPLDKEIIATGKEIVTGKEITVALSGLAERIGSEKIKKTLSLIITGIKSGGNISVLLEEISGNMRERYFVEKRASSNVLMYVIFIFVAIAFGAPLLFALSSILVEVMIDLLSSFPDAGNVSNLPFSMKGLSISPTFVIYYAVIFLIMMDVLASLILGLVNKGKEKEGLKFIAPLILISLVMFFLVRIGLSGFFANMFH